MSLRGELRALAQAEPVSCPWEAASWVVLAQAREVLGNNQRACSQALRRQETPFSSVPTFPCLLLWTLIKGQCAPALSKVSSTHASSSRSW